MKKKEEIHFTNEESEVIQIKINSKEERPFTSLSLVDKLKESIINLGRAIKRIVKEWYNYFYNYIFKRRNIEEV